MRKEVLRQKSVLPFIMCFRHGKKEQRNDSHKWHSVIFLHPPRTSSMCMTKSKRSLYNGVSLKKKSPLFMTQILMQRKKCFLTVSTPVAFVSFLVRRKKWEPAQTFRKNCGSSTI